MPILIGQKQQSDFGDPIGLLTDCHRRIERFLSILIAVTDQVRGGNLKEGERAALETAVRYFREAAPKHTEDEEESLFPRIRACRTPEARVLSAMLATLDKDHDVVSEIHDEIESLVELWLADGHLSEKRAHRLAEMLGELKGIYEKHIDTEESKVFPLAARLLDDGELDKIGTEMAKRRGVNRPSEMLEHVKTG